MVNESVINLAQLLGVEESSSQQLLLYIPNKDKNGNEIEDIEDWLQEAQEVMTAIGGGSTLMPPVDGTWLNPDTLQTISEATKIIYCFVDPEHLEGNLQLLRDFLHAFGRDTNQGEVAFEFAGRFYKINKYDKQGETS